MGSQHPYTSSGSKSRDTRGSEPSQDDLRDELEKKPSKGKGPSGDSAGEDTLDRGDASTTGSSGTRS